MRLVYSAGKHESVAKRGKLCNQCQARENVHSVKRGKLCNQCQARENVHSVKRGKLCNQCQARENEKLLPNAGKGAVEMKSRRHWAFVPGSFNNSVFQNIVVCSKLALKQAQNYLIHLFIHGKSIRYFSCLSFSLYSFQETSACRDLLLGSNTRQFKKFPFPHHGVFNEKSKTNLFSVRYFIPKYHPQVVTATRFFLVTRFCLKNVLFDFYNIKSVMVHIHLCFSGVIFNRRSGEFLRKILIGNCFSLPFLEDRVHRCPPPSPPPPPPPHTHFQTWSLKAIPISVKSKPVFGLKD